MKRRGFTLLELLIVVAMIGVLVSILLPSLHAARSQAQAVVCSSNVRQLVLANQLYAQTHDDQYVPGAARFLSNRDRWHGTRDGASGVFRSEGGPLIPYLGNDKVIRRCPGFPRLQRTPYAFEVNCGGYGYNNAYIGVRLFEKGDDVYELQTDEVGALVSAVAKPYETVMFSESAIAHASGPIEYSFVEPRFWVTFPDARADPTIHFRHRRHANVGWCDGHVDRQEWMFSWRSGVYETDPKEFDIGWFGVEDTNKYFDLK